MLPALLYFVSIALFAFVFLAATQIPESTWLVIAIFPVFIASNASQYCDEPCLTSSETGPGSDGLTSGW